MAFLDTVNTVFVPTVVSDLALVNASFESPDVGSGSGAYAGASTGPDVSWSFGGSAGVSGDDLSYARKRWLDNSTGQWLSLDPV